MAMTVPFPFPSQMGNAPAGLPEALALFAQRRAQQMPGQQPAQAPQVAGGGFWNSPGVPLPSLAKPAMPNASPGGMMGMAQPQQAMAYGAEPPKPAMPAAVGEMPPAAPASPAGAPAQGGNWWEQFSNSGGRDFLGNALTDLGAGLASGRDWQEGLGIATQRMAELGPQRQQMRAGQAERNQTAEWLKSKHPDLANLPPELGFKLAMSREQAAAGGGGDATFGLTPIWGTDAEGNPVIAQLSNRGGVQPIQMPDGVTFGKEPIRVEAGNQVILLDPVTRQQIGVIPKSGDVPAGFQQDANGNLVPMPNGPQDVERRIELMQAEQRARSADDRGTLMVNKIDDALNQANFWTTGPVGSVGRAMGGPAAVDLENTIKTVRSNIGFAELQAMREASPTGGALGQVAVQELDMLQSVLGSLDPSQGEEQLRKNLETIKTLLERQKMYRARALQERQQVMGGQNAQPQAPMGGAFGGNAADPVGLR
jgi:hypothetical protein